MVITSPEEITFKVTESTINMSSEVSRQITGTLATIFIIVETREELS